MAPPDIMGAVMAGAPGNEKCRAPMSVRNGSEAVFVRALHVVGKMGGILPASLQIMMTENPGLGSGV